MKKIFFPLMIILMLTGCGNFNDTNKLIIGIDDAFPPMSFYNENGKLVGFDIDLAKEAAKRMGLEVEFKPIDWNNKEEEITSGNIDMIWSGCDITPEREEYMIFSKPYIEDRQIILIKKNDDLDIHSEYDLEGSVVATQAGSNSDDYITKNKKLKSRIKEYKTYDKFGEMVEALKKDEIEVIICDELIARYEMESYPNQLKIINVKIGTVSESGVGFPKDKTALRDKVQETFDGMINDGTAREISLKWFKADLIKYNL